MHGSLVHYSEKVIHCALVSLGKLLFWSLLIYAVMALKGRMACPYAWGLSLPWESNCSDTLAPSDVLPFPVVPAGWQFLQILQSIHY